MITADNNDLRAKTTFDVSAENAVWDGLTADAGSNNYLYAIGILAVLVSVAVVILMPVRTKMSS
jgi:hypothetical protein